MPQPISSGNETSPLADNKFPVLPDDATLAYPIAGSPEPAAANGGMPFRFSSDSLPFREAAGFLFRYIVQPSSPAPVPDDSGGDVPHFSMHWLQEDAGRDDGEREKTVAETGLIMRINSSETFQTNDLGAAISHFESHFSFYLACRAAEKFDLLHLHGAAVETPAGAVLIIEDEDFGKTSLSMALMALGAAPIADDSLLFAPGAGQVACVPRYFRFDEGTHAALCEIKEPELVFTYHHGDETGPHKYHFVDPFEKKGGFTPGFSAPVQAVVFPAFSPENAETKVMPVRWADAFRILFRQTMTPIEGDPFGKWWEPIMGAKCYRVEWGNLADAGRQLWDQLSGGL